MIAATDSSTGNTLGATGVLRRTSLNASPRSVLTYEATTSSSFDWATTIASLRISPGRSGASLPLRSWAISAASAAATTKCSALARANTAALACSGRSATNTTRAAGKLDWQRALSSTKS